MSFRRPKKHHDHDSSLEDASSNAAPSSKRSALKAAFSVRKKHDAPIPTGTVASRISYLQSLGASAQNVASSARQPPGVKRGDSLTARRLLKKSGEDILEEVDDRGGFGRRTSAKFGLPAKRNDSPAFDTAEEKSHTILGWQIKRAKDHVDTRSIKSGTSGRSQEKRGLREMVKDVFRADKEEEPPADIPVSSESRRISVKDRAREWSEHERETRKNSAASLASSSKRLTIFPRKPIAFLTDLNVAPKKPFVSHFREDLDLPGVAKLEIEGAQVQEVGRLTADSSPSLATLVSPAVEEVRVAKRDFTDQPATSENKIETWLADASHESFGSEDSLQHSVATTSTGRVRSVQQMYTSHGIEQPSELFTQPDIAGKLVEGSRRCHVCRWVNSPVERCTCCGHRLCIDCEKVSYTPNSHKDGALQLDPSPDDEIMFASDDRYPSRITFEPHSWEKPIPKVLRDRKRSSRQSPKSIGAAQKPLSTEFVTKSRESSVIGEIKPLSVSKPGTRMPSLQRRPTPLKETHTGAPVVSPKPPSPPPSPPPPKRQAEPPKLATVALPAITAHKVVKKVPEPMPALTRPQTPLEVKQIKKRSTVKDSPFLKADRKQSGAGVNGDPSFRKTPLRRAQEMAPKLAPAAVQSAVIEEELHVPGHKVVELNGGDLIEVLPSAPGSLPVVLRAKSTTVKTGSQLSVRTNVEVVAVRAVSPKSDLPTSLLVSKSATARTEPHLSTHLTAAVAVQEESPHPHSPSSLLVPPQIVATSERAVSSICRECDSPSCRATHTGYRPYRHSISCSRKKTEAQVALQVDTDRLTPPSPRSAWKKLQVSSPLVPKPLSPVKRITPASEALTPSVNSRVVSLTADENPSNLQEYPFPVSVPGKAQNAPYPVDSDYGVDQSPTRPHPPEKYIFRNATPARHRSGSSLEPSHGNVRRSQSRGRNRVEKDHSTLHRDPSRSRSKHGHHGSQWQTLHHFDEGRHLSAYGHSFFPADAHRSHDSRQHTVKDHDKVHLKTSHRTGRSNYSQTSFAFCPSVPHTHRIQHSTEYIECHSCPRCGLTSDGHTQESKACCRAHEDPIDQRKVFSRKSVAQSPTSFQKSSSGHTTNSGASASTIESGDMADKQSHVQPQTSGAVFQLEREDTQILFSEAGGPPPESPSQASVGHSHLKKLGNTIKRNASSAHARVGGMVKPRERLADRAERRRRESAEARRRTAEALDSRDKKYSFAPSDDAELVSSTYQTGFLQKGQYIPRAARNAYEDESELEDQARLDNHGYMLDSIQSPAEHRFSQSPDPRTRASITRSVQSSNPQRRESLLRIPDPAIRRQHGASFHDDNQSTISGYSRVVEFDPELPREPAQVPSEREPARMRRYLSEHRPRRRIERAITYSKSVSHRMGADGPASFSFQGGSINSGNGTPPFSINDSWSHSVDAPGIRAELGSGLSWSGEAQSGMVRRSDAPSASTMEGMFIDFQLRMEKNTQQFTDSQDPGTEENKQRQLGFQCSSSPVTQDFHQVHRSQQFAEMTGSQREHFYAYQHRQHMAQLITVAKPYQHEDDFTSGEVILLLPQQATPGKRKFEERDVSEEPVSAKRQRKETPSQIARLPLPGGHMIGSALPVSNSQFPLATPSVRRWLDQRIGPSLAFLSRESNPRSAGPHALVNHSIIRLSGADPEDSRIVQSTEAPDPGYIGPRTLPTRTSLTSPTVLGSGSPLAVYSPSPSPRTQGALPMSASPLRPLDSISNFPASPTVVSMDENDLFSTPDSPLRASNQELRNWLAVHPYDGIVAAAALSQKIDGMAMARESDNVAEQSLEMAQMMGLMSCKVTQFQPGASVSSSLVLEEFLSSERPVHADAEELDQQSAYSPTLPEIGDEPPAPEDRFASPAKLDAVGYGRQRQYEMQTRMPKELTRALAAHLGVAPESVLDVRVKTSLYLDEETWHCQPWRNPRS